MSKPPKPISGIDQAKAGLQDDHDARDPSQEQAEGHSNPPKKYQRGEQKKQPGQQY